MSRRRTHQTQNPLKATAAPRKIASSIHWSAQ